MTRTLLHPRNRISAFRSRPLFAFAVAALLAVLAACGQAPVPPDADAEPNTPPALSEVADASTPRTDSIDIPLVITDEDPATVEVTASSDDQTLVTDADIEVLGEGAERTLRITPKPAGFGSVHISVMAEDAEGLTDGAVFTLNVTVPFDTQLPKRTASDAAADDAFGLAVAIDGDVAVVGAPLDDDGGADAGSVYVFERSGDSWNEVGKLTAGDAAADDRFGFSVAIDGDRIVVGAPLDDDGGADAGSAYVFERSGSAWNEVAKLNAGDAAADDYFGFSVAISGDTATVGAPLDDDGGTDAGSAYVFERSGSAWNEVAKLNAGDAGADDVFGISVAIDGDRIVVGAPLDDDGGADAGSAYVFERSGSAWNEVAKLNAGDAAADSYVGYSVAIDGDRIVVGAPLDDDGGADAGSAYVFERSGSAWNEVAKLSAGDAAAEDVFGVSVGIDGDRIVVGAHRVDAGATDTGAAYVFERSGGSWNEVARVTAGDAAADDHFGYSVDIAGDHVIVGAHQNDDAGNDSGSAYLFVR